MAQNVINFPVALKQNTNDDSTAYGKYFWVPVWPKTLNLKGLINRVATTAYRSPIPRLRRRWCSSSCVHRVGMQSPRILRRSLRFGKGHDNLYSFG